MRGLEGLWSIASTRSDQLLLCDNDCFLVVQHSSLSLLVRATQCSCVLNAIHRRGLRTDVVSMEPALTFLVTYGKL